MIDIRAKMDVPGRLNWVTPPGKWIIYRIGYSPSGSNPHPLPDDLISKSLEVDKMSAEQTVFHWKTVLDPSKKI